MYRTHIMSGKTSTIELINNTLTLFRLARETAVAHGKTEQVDHFTVVIDGLRKVIETSHGSTSTLPKTEKNIQNNFRTLLATLSSQEPPSAPGSSKLERNQIIVALATSGMEEIEIARKLGMTRDEVLMILQLNNRKNQLIGGKKHD